MNIFFVENIILIILASICSKRNIKTIFWVSAFVLILISGFHDGTGDIHGKGYDYPEYLNFFQGKDGMYGNINYGLKNFTLEWPYFVYCKLLRLFGDSKFIYIFTTALVEGIPFLYIVYKNSKNAAFSIYLLFTVFNTYTYLFYLACHRQLIATSCILSALIVWENYREKIFCKYIVIALLIIGLMAHSSSYFILPVLLLLNFVWKGDFSKIAATSCVVISFIIGLYAHDIINNYFHDFMNMLKGVEVIERSTIYTTEDIYVSHVATFNVLLPMSLLSMFFIWYSREEDLSSFYLKAFVVGICIYNVMSFMPLINRSVTILTMLGISGAVPKRTGAKYYRLCMLVLMFMFLYLAVKQYGSPSFRLLPYHFIWE